MEVAMPIADYVAANTAFAWDMYSTVLNESQSGAQKNVFFSPFSILSVLQLVYFGARGNTLKEMTNTLHFNDFSPTEMRVNIRTLAARISQLTADKDNGITLRVANKIFAEESYEFRADYMALVKDMGSEVSMVDFVTDFESVREKINTWVMNVTEEKIKNLLPKESIDSLTLMILVNAVHFKGTWKHKFDMKKTKERKFYRLDGTTKTVKMMCLREQLKTRYDAELGATILRLPFGKAKASQTEMVIILPKKKDGLLRVETKLADRYDLKLNDSWTPDTQLYMPRFEIEQSLPLKRLLMRLGIRELFSVTSADLGGVTDTRDVHVSDAVHRAHIAVDEAGAEAAAATAAVIRGRSMPRVMRVNVDRPFAFTIIDSQTQAIIFMGRVIDP